MVRPGKIRSRRFDFLKKKAEGRGKGGWPSLEAAVLSSHLAPQWRIRSDFYMAMAGFTVLLLISSQNLPSKDERLIFFAVWFICNISSTSSGLSARKLSN